MKVGTCPITWFNQTYLRNFFKVGETYKFYGKIVLKSGKKEMNSPVFDKIGESKNTGRIIPIYGLTYGLAQNALRKIIETGLKERKR